MHDLQEELIETIFDDHGPQNDHCLLTLRKVGEEVVRHGDVGVEVLVVGQLDIKGVGHDEIGQTDLCDGENIGWVRRQETPVEGWAPSSDAGRAYWVRQVGLLEVSLDAGCRVRKEVVHNTVVILHHILLLLEFLDLGELFGALDPVEFGHIDLFVLLA